MEPVRQKKKLLIIEDDFFIRELYEMQAKIANFSVITAVDGEEGLAKIRSEKPDMVLLDLMLPKVDGFTILKTIKTDPSCSGTAVMIFTNMENQALQQEAKNLGAVDYILKIKTTPDNVMKSIQNHFIMQSQQN